MGLLRQSLTVLLGPGAVRWNRFHRRTTFSAASAGTFGLRHTHARTGLRFQTGAYVDRLGLTLRSALHFGRSLFGTRRSAAVSRRRPRHRENQRGRDYSEFCELFHDTSPMLFRPRKSSTDGIGQQYPLATVWLWPLASFMRHSRLDPKSGFRISAGWADRKAEQEAN